MSEAIVLLKKILPHLKILSLRAGIDTMHEVKALIPDEFWKVTESKAIDKGAIKSAQGCPGARIESSGYRVSIK